MKISSDRTMLRHTAVGGLFLSLFFPPASVEAHPVPGDHPLVTVGGQTITNQQYAAKLNATVSKEVLRKMVFTALVRQAAAKAGVMPSDADVAGYIRELSIRQPALAQQAANPSVRADLKTNLALENLRIQGVTVSDAQVMTFYTHNAALFTLPSQVQTTMVVSQSLAASRQGENLLRQGVAPQVIATKPGLHVAGVNGFNINMGILPPAVTKKMGQTVLAMKIGEIKTVPISSGLFLTFKSKGGHGSELLPFPQVKAQAVRQAKLRKAISTQQELADLYRANPPHFSNPKYMAYFSDVAHYHAHS